MCSFLFSTKQINNINDVNFYLKFRGPDNTNVIKHNGHTFIHNLLSLTGAFTIQPLEYDDSFVLFNGEIYNFFELGNYDNDTKCILPLYKKYGIENIKDFINKLDGEFAIVIVDYKINKVIIIPDIFKTAPLYYAIDGKDIGASTYRTPLEKCGFSNIQKVKPNSVIIFDLITGEIKIEFPIHNFNLTQYKNSYDDWNMAFSKSIEKRSTGIDYTYKGMLTNTKWNMFLGLSSGYDSGVIACELSKQKRPFFAYTHIGSENQEILFKRKQILQNKMGNLLRYNSYMTTPEEWNIAHKYIEDNTETFNYTVYSGRSNYNEFGLKLIDDNGSNQFSNLCKKAKLDNCKIHLSGMGGDELYSDYGFNGTSKYNHSSFGGLFPKDLSTIFPWPSFYGSTMESYLAKEQYVGGSYSIESRFPFLDKYVVQEFLSLDVSLKNNKYKNVLHNYLEINNFPFCPGQKIGF